MNDPLSGQYKLRCRSCDMERVVRFNLGMGYKLGDQIPHDPSNSAIGRCPKCLRHQMLVVEAPTPPPIPGPKGFKKLPTK